LAPTVKSTVPLPVLFASDVTVSHVGELLTAAQAQVEAEALTPTLPAPPVAGADMPLEPMRYEQLTPDCVIAVVWFPTVTFAVRPDVLGFEATVKLNDPFPVPVVPEVIVNQEESLVTVQEQPDGAVTEAVPDPPAAGGVVVGNPAT
jgi:hypothetical protein